MIRPLLLVTLLSLLVLTGCRAARRGSTRATIDDELREIDQLFAARANPEQFEAAVREYLALLTEAPNDPRVLWRLARAYTVRGYAQGGEEGMTDYLTGREYALRCLKLQPEFGGTVRASAGTITPEAVEFLEDTELNCLAWATLSWARWLHERGPAGAAIDLPALEAMGEKVAALGGAEFGSGRGLETQGLTRALRPPILKGDPAKAREPLEQAIAAAPRRLTPKVDLALYVLRPLGEEEAADALLREVLASPVSDSDPDQPENLRAQRRAREALGIAEKEPEGVEAEEAAPEP